MAISFDCPHCGGHTDVDEQYAGQTGPCAHCGKTVTVPPLSGTPGYTTPAKGSPVPLVVLLVVVGLGLALFFCGGFFFLAFRAVPGPMPPPVVATAPAVATTVAPLPAVDQDTVQMAFTGPQGAQLDWVFTGQGQGEKGVAILPGRTDFYRESTYSIVLSNIADHPKVVIPGTLAVGPARSGAEAFLANRAVPIELTDDDIQQALDGKSVAKVVYLVEPWPGDAVPEQAETLSSTDVDPDADLYAEAEKRGIILAAISFGEEGTADAVEPD